MDNCICPHCHVRHSLSILGLRWWDSWDHRIHLGIHQTLAEKIYVRWMMIVLLLPWFGQVSDGVSVVKLQTLKLHYLLSERKQMHTH